MLQILTRKGSLSVDLRSALWQCFMAVLYGSAIFEESKWNVNTLCVRIEALKDWLFRGRSSVGTMGI